MLIFDSFPNRRQAERFARAATAAFGRKAFVFDNVDEAQAADPIPAQLVAPIVHVERFAGYMGWDGDEREVQALIAADRAGEDAAEELTLVFDGRFVGT